MRYWHQKTIRFFFGLFIGLCISVAAATGFLIAWVAGGPRMVNEFSPYIEGAFHTESGHYSLQIGETWLVWDGWKHPIDVRLRDIKILTRERQTFARLPEISVGLDLLSLPLGQVLPRSVTITHPSIHLFQTEDRSINFGFRQEAMEVPPDLAVAGTESAPDEPLTTAPLAGLVEVMLAPDNHSSLRKLRYIRIRNADVRIRNKRTGVFFQASKVGFIARRSREGTVEINIRGQLLYDNYQSTLESSLTLEANKPTVEGTFDFKGVEPSQIASFFSDDSQLGMLHLPLSGNTRLVMDKQGGLQRMQFMLESGAGEIRSDHLISPLPITWLHTEGQISNNGSDIQIDSLLANIDSMMLSANGVISLSNGDAAVRGNASLKNVPASSVALLWPPELAPLTREWVTANITEGVVPEATAKVNIQFGDLKRPTLPKESIDAVIGLENAKIRYLQGHPEVTNVQGSIHVDGIALDASLNSADYMKDSKLTNGHVIIEDLNPDNPYIKVNFDAETSARDLVRILGLPRLKHADRLGLKADGAEGNVKGSAALGFYFFAPKDKDGKEQEPDVDFNITGQATGMSHSGFMGKFDIKNADGSFAVNNKAIEFKGKGGVNGANVGDVDIKYLFTPEDGLDTFIDVKAASAPVEALPRFGYPDLPYLKGTLGIKASVKQGGATELYNAAIDLTNASINASDISWQKPEKEPGVIEFTAAKKNDALTISSLMLKGKNADVKGAATFNKELTAVQSLSLSKCVLGQTELSRVEYAAIDGGYSVDISGKALDMSGWMNRKDNEESAFSFKNFPALKFKSDVGQVFFGKRGVVSAFKGEVACDKIRCNNADVSGKTGAGSTPFTFRILRNPKGQRQVSLHSKDAGSFFKAFDIYDNMEGGDLALTGNFNDAGLSLKGRFDIRKYTLKDAPVLAKILSLASLTGFFDTLQGKGIAFDRLTVPYTLSNDVVTLAKAKMYGPAVGMTMDGTVTIPKMAYNMEGTVVPSYTLNSMAGKVPLFGQLLTGGDGQGVFAARYNVTGTEKEPKVSVNPLSILTPGFLRGLFDVFDKPDQSQDNKPAEEGD